MEASGEVAHHYRCDLGNLRVFLVCVQVLLSLDTPAPLSGAAVLQEMARHFRNAAHRPLAGTFLRALDPEQRSPAVPAPGPLRGSRKGHVGPPLHRAGRMSSTWTCDASTRPLSAGGRRTLPGRFDGKKGSTSTTFFNRSRPSATRGPRADLTFAFACPLSMRFALFFPAAGTHLWFELVVRVHR